MNDYNLYKNWKALEDVDKKAKENGKLVGRYIQHPFADGYAIYKIVKENTKTVKIRVVKGIGDDWVLPAWGKECDIHKDLALKFISQREIW